MLKWFYSILQKIGAAKANSWNQVQGLHTCLGVMSMWIAAHFFFDLLYSYFVFFGVTFFLEFIFDPLFEPHGSDWKYTPDWDDFWFYQLGAFLGYITYFL